MKNMYKYASAFLVVIVGLICLNCSSHKEFAYKFDSDYIVFEDEAGKEVLSGAVTWKEWLDDVSWNRKTAMSTTADPLVSRSVCNVINNGKYFLLIFAGTWCEDSRSQLPIIFKMIQLGKLKESRYQLIGVDKDKVAYKLENLDIKVNKIPAIVIFDHDKEIGRIEEFPDKSWEQDILNILYKN
ncbi:MAG: thioredoxin family protein [Candidatus Kapabacteria bacterium]|nr:thioredoxin family protein [Candidatus Kapabacteria bacterium]